MENVFVKIQLLVEAHPFSRISDQLHLLSRSPVTGADPDGSLTVPTGFAPATVVIVWGVAPI